MPDINLLTENNILKMNVNEAAEFCGYDSLYKFRFDFRNKFGKQYREMRLELKKKFIKENYIKPAHLRLSDKEVAQILNSTRVSIIQMRAIMGLTRYRRSEYLKKNKNKTKKQKVKKRKFPGIVPEMIDKVIKYENNLKISARIISKKIPKKYRIRINRIDEKHLNFEVLYGRKKYIEGEYYNPYLVFDAKEKIQEFVGRIIG